MSEFDIFSSQDETCSSLNADVLFSGGAEVADSHISVLEGHNNADLPSVGEGDSLPCSNSRSGVSHVSCHVHSPEVSGPSVTSSSPRALSRSGPHLLAQAPPIYLSGSGFIGADLGVEELASNSSPSLLASSPRWTKRKKTFKSCGSGVSLDVNMDVRLHQIGDLVGKTVVGRFTGRRVSTALLSTWMPLKRMVRVNFL